VLDAEKFSTANGQVATNWNSSHEAGDGIEPKVVQFGERPDELTFGGLEAQVVSAKCAEPNGGNAEELRAFNDFDSVPSFG
jgi:hypothetical protein